MSKVKILDDIVVNQIAAGEVVERPSSVVKELVENAIDAGSTEISVAITNGGKSSIEVKDNGCGMTREDLLVAVQRFGTSKIRQSEDLEKIATLGFRGEAVPSIASVSKFSIFTAPSGESGNATFIHIEGGVQKVVEDVSAPAGTRIVVKSLFYNVPARKKFLRTDTTEAGQVKSLLTDFALAYPHIRFSLSVDTAAAIVYPQVQDFSARVAQVKIAGSSPVAFSEEFQLDAGSIRIDAVVCSPIDSVGSAQKLRLLVNGRSVRDKVLLKAVRDGYGTFLRPGRHPTGIISLRMPPEEVDVNVHPQKTEVRFRNSSEVFRAVLLSVSRALSRSNLNQDELASAAQVPGTQRTSERSAVSMVTGDSARLGSTGTSMNDDTREGEPMPGAHFTVGGEIEAAKRRLAEVRPISAKMPFGESKVAPVSMSVQAFEYQDESRAERAEYGVSNALRNSQTIAQSSGVPDVSLLQSMRLVGQIFSLYLLFEGESERGGVFGMLDMHAAHERVVFFRLKQQFRENTVERQQLLLPHEIVLEADEQAQLEQGRELIERLGFSIEVRDELLIVTAVPTIFIDAPITRIFRDLVAMNELGSWERFVETELDHVLSRIACHGSVRSGRSLKEPEVRSLVEALTNAEASGLCPHGRPVVRYFSEYELEQFFGRVQS